MSNYCYHCMNELTDDQNVCPYCHKDNTPDNIVYRLRPGTVLDNKYLVGNCLGEGGFGITYIGRDLSLDIKVAIKEYYPNGYVNRNNTVNQLVTATTESQKHIFYKGKDNFLEEARKVAKFLGEPGIVGIREYFEANGTAYIIMEYLDGENLASYIKQNGTFDAQKIFRLMLPITYSLKRIHNTGMIHRDISPDNIMYLRNGSLKLMDFGSARYFTNEQKEMSVLLKQGYAPEEQYRKNGKQGPWTDVYGLCATIYRCITGNIPEDALDRLRDDELVPPSKMGISIPPAMENILLYGLAVFRENRCQSMEELSALIEQALDDPQGAAQKTANLVPKHPSRIPSDQPEQHTYLADDGMSGSQSYPSQPVTGDRSGQPAHNTNDRGYAGPVQQTGPSYATPVTSSQRTGNNYATPVTSSQKTGNNYATPVTSSQKTGNNYATPVSSAQKNTSYTAPSASQQLKNTGYSGTSYTSPSASSTTGSYGTQTSVAVKPKKKKTGLIIGLIIGGVVLVALAVSMFLIFGFGNTSIDGTYRLVEMVSNGEDQTKSLSNVNIDLVIKDNVGTFNMDDSNVVWTFNTQNKTITNEDNQSTPYRLEGRKLIIEDTNTSDKMVFQKQ